MSWKLFTKVIINFFHYRLRVLENMTTLLANATSNDLQILKIRINDHDEDLDILGKVSSMFWPQKIRTFTKWLWHSTTIMWHSKCWKKHTQHIHQFFENIWNFMTHTLAHLKTLSALDALSKARLMCKIIDSVTPEWYLQAITYDVEKNRQLSWVYASAHSISIHNYVAGFVCSLNGSTVKIMNANGSSILLWKCTFIKT